MSRIERAFNLCLGLSVLSWSLLALLQPFAVPRLVIAALNAVVGVLLLARAPLLVSGSARALALSLPGVAIAGLAIKLSAPLEAWSQVATALFAAGGVVAAASFLALGRSFAILPALRSIAIAGPYRVVRHPAYLGELLMVLACLLAGPSWPTAIAAGAAVPLVVLRIHLEERLLARDPRYQSYSERTRFRLVPGLW
ncbi:MAG TPA: methyltransferase [Polyangia bacterium]|nr:methyltransferase [Polyangia bacterium]